MYDKFNILGLYFNKLSFDGKARTDNNLDVTMFQLGEEYKNYTFNH